MTGLLHTQPPYHRPLDVSCGMVCPMDETTPDKPLLGVVQPPTEPERVKVLREAAALITGDRQAQYGSPTESLTRISLLWTALFPERSWTAADVALAMMALKLSRASNSYTRDSAVDLAGYAALWSEANQ